jgi:hypothetical protein
MSGRWSGRPLVMTRELTVAIRDPAGAGALQDALATTNTHLEAVLRELQELNNERLQQWRRSCGP